MGAAAVDVGRRRRGRVLLPQTLLAGERAVPGAGSSGGSPLLSYALIKPPYTWFIATSYARTRRALHMAVGHSRTDPARIVRLREQVTERTRALDETNDPARWQGVSQRQLLWDAWAARTRLPWHEKLFLLLSLLVVLPSLAYLLVGDFKDTQGIQKWFADGAGLQVLIWAAVAGLLLIVWRLVATLASLRTTLRLPLAEPAVAAQLRLTLCAGSLLTGCLLLSRRAAIAHGEKPLDVHDAVDPYNDDPSFLLERFLDVGLPLLLTVATLALLAMPYALPLELMLGGGVGEMLLGAALPRLAPYLARGGAQALGRLASRGAMPWARGALGRGRGAYARPGDRVASGRTDPVDLATGRMFLELTDVELPGTLPLALTRRADSGYRGGRWFGPCWSSSLDERLEHDEQGVVHFTPDGLLVAYPPAALGGAPVWPTEPTAPRRALTRATDGTWTITELGAPTRHFTPDGLLSTLTDHHGNRISFTYTPSGAPSAITHSGGYRLRILHDPTLERITGIELATLDDEVDVRWIRLVSYAYDTHGNLTEQTRATPGSTTRFTPDSHGRITSWTDSNSRSYHYRYDDQDRVVAETSSSGALAFTLTYNGTHPDHPGCTVTTVTSSTGDASHYICDSRHLVTAIIDPAGGVTRHTYDEAGRTVATTDPLGRTTGWSYTEDGQLTQELRTDGSRIAITYDDAGNPVTVTAPDDTTTHHTYDHAGNLTSVTDPTGAVTRYAYDPSGTPIAVTDPTGATTRITSDTAGLPLSVTDPDGATTLVRRDTLGHPVSVTDPLGAVTGLNWSVDGHLLSRTGPDGAVEMWTYDGEGNTTSHTDPLGATTRFTYGEFDRIATRTDPDGATYHFTYDTLLRLAQVTNPQGLQWGYTYDPAGHLLSETDFDDRTTHYTRDAAGRTVSIQGPDGAITHHTWDTLDRLTTRETPDSRTTYTWDPCDRLVDASNPDTHLTRTYDTAGRLLIETVNGRPLQITYDAMGRPTSRTPPSGVPTTYTHSPGSLLTRISTAGRDLALTYDPAGREVTRTLLRTHSSPSAPGLTLTTTRDPSGRPTLHRALSPSGHTVAQHTYTWRPDGTLSTRDDARYILDPMGRVTEVHAADAPPGHHPDAENPGHPHTPEPPNAPTETYTYDPAGNITHATGHIPSPGPRT
ncbi:hypothetical protein DY218_00455, partial [Streptomyces triticagri]